MREMAFGDLFHVENKRVPGNMPICSGRAWNSITDNWERFITRNEAQHYMDYWWCYTARFHWDMLRVPFQDRYQ